MLKARQDASSLAWISGRRGNPLGCQLSLPLPHRSRPPYPSQFPPHLCLPGDALAVVDLGGADLALDLELAAQPVHDDLQVQLTWEEGGVKSEEGEKEGQRVRREDRGEALGGEVAFLSLPNRGPPSPFTSPSTSDPPPPFLTHALDDGLVGLLIAAVAERGVLLRGSWEPGFRGIRVQGSQGLGIC